MSESNGLPKGWCWAPIGTLAPNALIGLDRGRSSQSNVPIGIPYIKMGNITTDGRIQWDDLVYVSASPQEIERFSIAPGDLLFNTRNSRELVGKVGRVPDVLQCPTILFNNNLMRLRCVPGTDSRFVCYQMIAPRCRDHLDTIKRSTTNVAAIYAKDLLPLPILLAPANEQRRIVERIEELFSDLDAGVAALERARANLKRYRSSVLKAAVEGSLTAEWRAKHPKVEPASKLLEHILAERRRKWEADQLAKFAAAGKQPPKNWQAKYVEPAPPDTSRLPELPAKWCWASVEQITENFDGRRIPVKAEDRSQRQGDFPYYGASGIIDYVDDYLFDGHFLLLAEDGANLLSRSTPIAFEASGKFWVNNHAHILQTCGTIPLSYLCHYFNGTRCDFSITGTAQPKLTQAAMNRLIVPLPPLPEQCVISDDVAEMLSQIEAAEVAIDHGLLRATRLRQSILKQAFEGRLIPQDPTDEPASVLLERLRASSAQEASGNGEGLPRKRIRGGKPSRHWSGDRGNAH